MSRYSSQTSKSTSLLKDGSWIKKMDDEDEAVDQDPNFGKTVLGRYRSNEALDSSEAEDTKTTKSMSTSTSVQALTKRFSGSQDELRSSTLPPSKTTSSYTKSTYSTLKSDSPKTTTTSKTTVTEEPKKGTTTTTVIKDGKTTTETIITTTESVRSPVLKSPTKTETFTERVLKSSNKGLSPTFSPTRTTKVTETTVTSNKDAEDQLYDKLLPSSIKDNFSPMDSTTVSSSKTTTVKSSGNGDGIKTTTTTRTSSLAEDDLYGTLLPKSMTSNLPSPVSDDYSSDRNSYLYTRPDSSGVTSSSVYNIYRSRSRSDDSLGDPIYSKSSVTSVYASPERTVLEKDLCTICRKPFIGDAKMVLDEMKINCHASCFKCEVCNNTLGHMKAGDSMWIYKRMVHCENCFEVTREKWRR